MYGMLALVSYRWLYYEAETMLVFFLKQFLKYLQDQPLISLNEGRDAFDNQCCF